MHTDLTERVMIMKKRAEDNGPSSPSGLHLLIMRNSLAKCRGSEATGGNLPTVWLVWPQLQIQSGSGGQPWTGAPLLSRPQ